MSVKGLHKMIYPFAPDQSGAVSVLYELGGMIIIVDAGGCAGNVCGFDEPRWLGTKSAVFSAGLRDMDAILGRDDLLMDKIEKASGRLDAGFVAIIGTPVPATIATDYRALKRMAEKRTGLPVITMDTNGIAWYDEGIKKAYLELFRRFAPREASGDTDTAPCRGDDLGGASGIVGVLGITPLDTGRLDAAARTEEILKAQGADRVICYGSVSGRSGGAPEAAGADPLDSFREVSADLNIVAAPGGLAAARRLKEKYGTPYECRDPLAADAWDEAREKYSEENGGADLKKDLAGKKILIIHQQIRANTVRDIIRAELRDGAAGHDDMAIDVAGWFMMDRELKEEGDFRLKEESDFFDTMENGGYDVIMADGIFRKAAKGFDGIFVDLPHFAVSGRYR